MGTGGTGGTLPERSRSDLLIVFVSALRPPIEQRDIVRNRRHAANQGEPAKNGPALLVVAMLREVLDLRGLLMRSQRYLLGEREMQIRTWPYLSGRFLANFFPFHLTRRMSLNSALKCALPKRRFVRFSPNLHFYGLIVVFTCHLHCSTSLKPPEFLMMRTAVRRGG